MTNPIEVMKRHAGREPVPVFEMLADLGLGPEFKRLDDEMSGYIERKADGGYCVVINDSHSLNRQRFTAAHELGHYIYHRSLLGAGVGDTRAYRAAGSLRPNSAVLPVHERQANSFAANLLMPRAALSQLSAGDRADVAALAERFGVSQEAMRIRLGLPRGA